MEVRKTYIVQVKYACDDIQLNRVYLLENGTYIQEMGNGKLMKITKDKFEEYLENKF